MTTKAVIGISATLAETPQDFFDRLDAEFGFDLDVCATRSNAKCERFYSRKDDGLAQPWTGTCWCNPPYGQIKHWLRKGLKAMAMKTVPGPHTGKGFGEAGLEEFRRLKAEIEAATKPPLLTLDLEGGTSDVEKELNRLRDQIAAKQRATHVAGLTPEQRRAEIEADLAAARAANEHKEQRDNGISPFRIFSCRSGFFRFRSASCCACDEAL